MTREIERQREAQAADLAKYEQRRRGAEVALAEVDRKLARLLDDLPTHILNERKCMFLEERRDAEAMVNRFLHEESAVTITPGLETTLQDLSTTIRTALPTMTFEERRKLLEILRVRVDVIDVEHLRVSGIVTDAVLNISTT